MNRCHILLFTNNIIHGETGMAGTAVAVQKSEDFLSVLFHWFCWVRLHSSLYQQKYNSAVPA